MLTTASRSASTRPRPACEPSTTPRRREGCSLDSSPRRLPGGEEARMVVEACGLEVRLDADLGVAGLHRFVGPLAATLEWGCDVLIVAAGMDGVLPGLVAGLIDVPVIGLPVSTGYGRGGAGEAALTTMLQPCSTGLVVVTIDNGAAARPAAVPISP